MSLLNLQKFIKTLKCQWKRANNCKKKCSSQEWHQKEIVLFSYKRRCSSKRDTDREYLYEGYDVDLEK